MTVEIATVPAVTIGLGEVERQDHSGWTNNVTATVPAIPATKNNALAKSAFRLERLSSDNLAAQHGGDGLFLRVVQQSQLLGLSGFSSAP